jgi:phosphoglycolate phosphatase-like HAD superfamily hydrolase
LSTVYCAGGCRRTLGLRGNVAAADTDMPSIIICDLDGTLADIEHRVHHIRGGGPSDWNAFFRACTEDLPIRNTIHLVQRLHEVGFRLLIVSGRSDLVRIETEEWLEQHGVPYDALVMRRDEDHRSDTIVKADMVDELGIGPEDVLMVLDDRTKVVEMWRERGFHTFQVAPGDF